MNCNEAGFVFRAEDYLCSSVDYVDGNGILDNVFVIRRVPDAIVQ
jgi:hypothetical protein